MKLKNAHYFIPLLQAAAQGKTLQCQSSSGEWWDVTENTEMGFTGAPESWRIKPEPTLRPWKPEEVPVGAMIQYKNKSHFDVELITGRSTSLDNPIVYSGFGKQITADILFKSYEHSLDYGKTWHPCGVME